MKAPCKDCKDRYLGCHAKCDKYIAFKAQVQYANEVRRKMNDKGRGEWTQSQRESRKGR